MTGTRFGVLLLAVALALASSSCRLFRREAKAAPTTPAAKPVATASAAKSGPPPEPAKPPEETVIAPPQLPPAAPNLAAQPPIPVPKPTAKPPETRRARNRIPRHSTAEPPPEAAEAKPATPTPAPAPQLQQILSPEQQRECNEAIDTSLARVRNMLGSLNGRRLSREQETQLARIRSFVAQAEQARKSDLLTARALAERADVIAQDLAKTVH